MVGAIVLSPTDTASHEAVMDRPDKVVNPARGQLNRDNYFSPYPRCSRLRIGSREAGPVVLSRVSLLILHTQAESGAYSRDSRFPPRRAFIPSTAIGSVPIPMMFTAESPLAKGH